ncbi:3-ketosteroid-delta-1-dehydrogenase [Mycolicibacterium chitae]|uniref:3-oxosteroid 1-dehydrogenase n=1 Tax=Mycolicibacterium chitae TaxID=1792 RepID=A0A448IDX5_MYCCI|nr:3-ketosteroid-delta-1-dehydrogenase [Mycolicibacterium chitae]MCV7107754.1 3-ketosteroid-delta-1-dehydrogenase [Mycolicibacterium chitae]BBZ01854.1 3-ketosteroid-delta-1-dehydrogenase [Mycolicibacterium chitae]VEG50683.1 Fumarate reductase/succinate dehydrogenase flavoprotein domain protein [Mycolicibacterium chitae]
MTDPQTLAVDLLVVGSGTGMAAALAAHELGLSTLIVEKTAYVGGSTARSGGAFWMPANPILIEAGSDDTMAAGRTYLESVIGDAAPADRARAFLDHGAATVEMLRRTTPMKFQWAKDYSDYHPELPGGSAVGRTCECRPFNTAMLGSELRRLRPGVMKSSFPMPVTGADYRWLNLMARVPRKAVPRILRRAVQGIGGLALRRRYAAGGQALAAGMFAGVVQAGIPVWTQTPLVRLLIDGDRVHGAVVERDGTEVTITARRGVVLATGGFDHRMDWRQKFQSESLRADLSLGAEGNTGDGIRAAQDLGAGIGLMDQAWWFPAFAPLPDGEPTVMLAERSLPGCLLVDQTGNRFINEATDYMTFGQQVLQRERDGNPVEVMWMVFDQQYRNSYLLAAELFPRMPIPKTWYDAGIAHRSDDVAGLARSVGVDEAALAATLDRFNQLARTGKDTDFGRGDSAYDRYYGDPTRTPNPNLRPLEDGPFYAVKVVLSDLGTCGGVRADTHGRVLREDGAAIDGLYAIGNTAANTFGASYPGAGATIGQGLVFGYLAARHAAGRTD